MTPAQVRKIALALPGAAEQDHWGNPSFRAGGRIFATMQLAAKTAHLLKLEPEEVEAFGQAPGFSVEHWGRQSYLRAVLARVDTGLFEELLVTCYRRVAPKRALEALDAGTPIDRRDEPTRKRKPKAASKTKGRRRGR